MQGVPFPLDFKKLPNCAGLHKCCRFAFYFFEIMKQFERFRIAFGEQLFKLPLKPRWRP